MRNSDTDDDNENRLRSVDLLNISGPYGAGKDTLINALIREFGSRVHRVRTLTTRPSSPAVDPSYATLPPDEFMKATRGPDWIVNHQLSATVAYATDLNEIRNASAAGKHCVHTIFAGDAGAGELRRRLGSRVVSVSVQVSKSPVEQQLATLRDRLLARGRGSSEEIDQRLDHQYEVINYILSDPEVVAYDGRTYKVFDYNLINQNLDEAIAETMALAAAAWSS
jgi:guanylate kinase